MFYDRLSSLHLSQTFILVSGKRRLGASLFWSQGGVPTAGAMYTVASYGNISGTYSSVTGGTNTSCLAIEGTPQLQYGQTQLTVLLTTTNSCGSGLSSGAIAGIAVGCTVAGLAIIAAIIGAVWAWWKNRKELDRIHKKIERVNTESEIKEL